MAGRLDYIVELLREHKRKYHKPTHDILKALFEGNTCLECAEREEPLFIEPMFEKLTRQEWTIKEDTASRKKYDTMVNERNEGQKRMNEILEKITLVKPRFGKAYYKLELNVTELAIFKKKLENHRFSTFLKFLFLSIMYRCR